MSGDEEQRAARNPHLREFYSSSRRPQDGHAGGDPHNLNSPHFDPDMYLHKLIKESALTELMDTEANIYKQIQALDSEMQTLVYENYNKFISATDTIRKMKVDFKKMEDEMEKLAENMQNITSFSGKVSNTLLDRREEINRLSTTHVTLKKLQFLFELPAKLRSAIGKQNYKQAVDYYCQSQSVLEQYRDMPSLQALQAESADCVGQLTAALEDRLQDSQSSLEQMSESVQLLLRLNQPPEALCQRVIAHAQTRLQTDLRLLTDQVDLLKGTAQPSKPTDTFKAPMDIMEFVDVACSHFLSNICLFVASYNSLFVKEDNSASSDVAVGHLSRFMVLQMEAYFRTVEERLSLEDPASDPAVLARALDRFHRRLLAINNVLPDTDFSRTGLDLVTAAAERKCRQSLTVLENHLSQCISDARQALVLSRQPGAAVASAGDSPLAEQLATFIGSMAERIRTVVTGLQAFIQPELSFGVRAQFGRTFCRHLVREGVLVAFFHHLAATCQTLCEPTTSGADKTPAAVILLLSKVCRDLETSTVHYLLNYVDELLHIEDKSGLTQLAAINQKIHQAAQALINHYVRVQGLAVSQMLRKSVETRDWLHTIEPRTVRPAMKRVVEELSLVDAQVGTLYEEGQRREHSSDSSRRTFHSMSQRQQRHEWSSYAPSQVDSSLVANIHKLFSERIEIFAPVEFSKVSILTGIIKISLKTLLECVRLRTFSKFGLQQIQVDVYFLQVNLWRFVADEKLLHGLLDEVLGSAIHRCLEPVLMEFSVIEVLCERS